MVTCGLSADPSVLVVRTLRAVLLLVAVCTAACGEREPPAARELSGATMGTTFSVTVAAQEPGLQPGDELAERVHVLLDEIEQSMSTYVIQSEVSRFNASQSTEWFEVSARVCAAVADSLSISALTNGAFDITVGPVVDLWGFGPEGARTQPPDDATIAAARARVGYEQVDTDCRRPALRKRRADVRVDLSGYAKGYAVDQVADLLDAEGVDNYMIEIGGELRARGVNASGNSWRVAIESPGESGPRVRRVVPLSDAAMATSGDYRNYFEFAERRYSHTIDPRLGVPVSHDLAAVTVVSDEASLADALATALLVLGPDDGMTFAEEHGIAAYFQRRVGDEFAVSMSPAFRRLAANHPQSSGDAR